MEELIKYLEETYKLTSKDLALPDDERNFLLGQLSMIEDVKEIHLHGIPNDDEDET